MRCRLVSFSATAQFVSIIRAIARGGRSKSLSPHGRAAARTRSAPPRRRVSSASTAPRAPENFPVAPDEMDQHRQIMVRTDHAGQFTGQRRYAARQAPQAMHCAGAEADASAAAHACASRGRLRPSRRHDMQVSWPCARSRRLGGKPSASGAIPSARNGNCAKASRASSSAARVCAIAASPAVRSACVRQHASHARSAEGTHSAVPRSRFC